MPDSKVGLFKHPVIVAFLASIASIEFIRMSLFLTFLPSFLTNLHYNTAALGLVMSANLLADNLSKSATGWLVDNKGPWPILLAGSCTVFGGVLLIMNFHSSLFLLFLAAILIGLGASPTWPAVITGSIQVTGEAKRATMISMISVVWLAGGGLGPVLMGFLIDTRMRQFLSKFRLPILDAYKTGFVILLVMAVWAIVINILGWVSWQRIPHIQKAKAERSDHKPKIRDIFHRLWQVKGLIPGMFFQTLSLGMLMPNLLPYVTGKLGLSEAQYSTLLLIGGGIVVLFMIPVGQLADHWGTRGFLVGGFVLASSSILFLAIRGNATNVWWLVGLAGLSYALIQPAWNALLAGAIPPEQRGVLMGLFMSVEGLGFAVGPLVGGLLGTFSGSELAVLRNIGQDAPFYVSGICLGFMALVYLFYPFHQYQLKGD